MEFITPLSENFDFTTKVDSHVTGVIKPGFYYTANATTTTQKQSDYKIEQSSFKLIALF